jgi:hypothetical protein
LSRPFGFCSSLVTHHSSLHVFGLLLLAAVVCLAGTARGEEITLKDGQKIVGTIVGYEKDMFRVETSYGIALVRKDKVVSIQVSKPDAEAAPRKPSPTQSDALKPNPDESARTASPKNAPTPPPPEAAPEKPPAPPPKPPPPPVSRPLDVPLPAHIQEHVDGATYINDTFQFSMFKPPDWKVYEGVPKETGSGIMAMGAEDERTLLLVDRQVWSGTPDLSSDQVEAKLRQTYQEYRKVSEQSFQCDGQPAIRRTFTGVMDGAEWHGVAVHVAHGNMVFGIIGLTSAETFEFQQAIFSKIIRTFHFLAPPSPGAGPDAANPSR